MDPDSIMDTESIKFVALNCHGFKGNIAHVNKLIRQYDCIFYLKHGYLS